jgi:hypothetical protein
MPSYFPEVMAKSYPQMFLRRRKAQICCPTCRYISASVDSGVPVLLDSIHDLTAPVRRRAPGNASAVDIVSRLPYLPSAFPACTSSQ